MQTLVLLFRWLWCWFNCRYGLFLRVIHAFLHSIYAILLLLHSILLFLYAKFHCECPFRQVSLRKKKDMFIKTRFCDCKFSLCIPNSDSLGKGVFTKNSPQVFKSIWKHCHPLRVTHPRTLQAICSMTCTANSQFNGKVDHWGGLI